jgi:hypothetical protein
MASFLQIHSVNQHFGTSVLFVGPFLYQSNVAEDFLSSDQNAFMKKNFKVNLKGPSCAKTED